MDDLNFTLATSKIAIIGLGLMGGSLALGLRGKCAAIYGIDPNPATLELALSQQIVDYADSDSAKLPPEIDLVILAAPVPSIIALIHQLPFTISHPCIVMDMGSTKKLIVESMSRLPERFDPIGGHPICGKEKLSLANAERTLYYAAPFLLTPLERTSARALSAADGFRRSCHRCGNGGQPDRRRLQLSGQLETDILFDDVGSPAIQP